MSKANFSDDFKRDAVRQQVTRLLSIEMGNLDETVFQLYGIDESSKSKIVNDEESHRHK